MSQTASPEQTAAQATASMQAKPEKQHRWLQKLIGDWTFETDPSTPQNEKASGTERFRQLGDLWVLGEGQGEMPGGTPANTLMTLGYDPAKSCFVGSWVGSMMTHLWIYEGKLDSSARLLTLNSEGPSMSGDGSLAQYQDIIEFLSDDHRTLTGRTRNPDGTWHRMMVMHYRRTR